VKLEGGLGELKDISNFTRRWTPLHLVRVYFETGSTEVTDRDAGTLIKLVRAMTKPKFKGGGEIPQGDLVHKGTYRIEISGHYSNCWDQHDKELRQIEAREAAGKSRKKDEHRKDALMALKQAENEGLAMIRARHVQETLQDIITIEPEFVEYQSRIKHMLGNTPVVESPVDTDPYANNPNDRRVEVRVSALLNYPHG
jgi:hypothetical protein